MCTLIFFEVVKRDDKYVYVLQTCHPQKLWIILGYCIIYSFFCDAFKAYADMKDVGH